MEPWLRKFRLAARGIMWGIRGQSSFAVHLPSAIAVISLAILLHCPIWEWCVLIACIGGVFAAELANSALEELAAVVSPEHNVRVGRALDIASGAVLIASITAAIIGLLVFLPRLL